MQAEALPEQGGRADLLTALILTVAGLLSAWASFQGGMWGGLEAEHFHRANAALTESSRHAIAAGQQEAENAALFIAWLGAVAEGKEVRARYLEKQFDPSFADAFRRWRRTLPDKPGTTAGAIGRPDFAGLMSGPSQAARAQAKVETAEANRTGNIADRYDRWTVVLATALFLAGMAAVVRARTAQRLLIGLSATLTLCSLVALVLLPVSFNG